MDSCSTVQKLLDLKSLEKGMIWRSCTPATQQGLQSTHRISCLVK